MSTGLIKYIETIPAYKNTRAGNFELFGLFFLCLTLFLLPFPLTWTLYSAGSFLFFCFVCWILDFKNTLSAMMNNLWLILPPVIYYILHVLSILSGGHKWLFLVERLLFLLIPVIGFPLFVSDLLKKNLKFIYGSFLLGIISIAVFELIRAAWQSISYVNGEFNFNPLIDSWIPRFFSYGLSYIEHPTYFSMKILLGIVLLILTDITLKISSLIRTVLLVFFSVFIYLLSSRAGLLILIIILIYQIYRLLSKRKKKFALLIVPLFLGFSIYIILLNYRVENSYKEIFEKINSQKTELSDFDHRTRVWYSASQIIARNPIFGVGVSNAIDEMEKELRYNGFIFEADSKYNAHNQFLETQLSLGVAGSVVLIWMLLFPFFIKKKTYNRELYNLFLVIIIINFLFESMLVRQWGIMFFLLFYYIVILVPKEYAENEQVI